MARKDPEIEAAEDELVACMQMLWRMPDRERSFLYHSTLRWPAMVRDQGDYPDEDEPRPPLSRREVERVERMFNRSDAYVRRAIDRRDLRLVAVVATMKAGGARGGFGWDDVWKAMAGQMPTGAIDSDGQLKLRKVTSDAMRKRYEGAMVKLAAAMRPRCE